MQDADPAVTSIEIDSNRDDGANTTARLHFSGAPGGIDHASAFLTAYASHVPARVVTLADKLADLPDDAARDACLRQFLLGRFGGETVEIVRQRGAKEIVEQIAARRRPQHKGKS